MVQFSLCAGLFAYLNAVITIAASPGEHRACQLVVTKYFYVSHHLSYDVLITVGQVYTRTIGFVDDELNITSEKIQYRSLLN